MPPKRLHVDGKTHGTVRALLVLRVFLTKILTTLAAARVSNHKKLRGGAEFIDAIPKTPSGKLLRRDLREKARSVSRV